MPSILHVAQSSEYGLGRVLAELATALDERGWDVTLAGTAAGSLPVIAAGAGVRFEGWEASRDPGGSTLREARDLGALVRRIGPDIVHLHSSKAGLAGRLALRGRWPTVFQPHAWSFFAVDGARRQLAIRWERLGARWADAIVCGSAAEQAAGADAGIRAAWHVIPNAVDTTVFHPGERDQARARLGLGPEPLAVCASRLVISQKGQDVLLEAWPAVRHRHPDARLVLVGDGPDEAMLRATAGDGVSFAGRTDAVIDWFVASDVVVQPSRYETLSLSVLEAMACGRPVVATDAIGMREAIGEAGAVVPIGDSAGLAAAVSQRLGDPARAQAEGRAARERAVRSLDLRQWAERMERLLGEVSSRPSGGAG